MGEYMRIGFIGLGAMGLGMAQQIQAAGFDMTVYNRTATKAAPLVAAGATLAHTPAEAASVDMLITVVSDDAAEQALIAQGIANTLPTGSIHMATTTMSAKLARELTALHRAAGQYFVAAPVMGSSAMAANGQLFVLSAGDAAARAKCQRVFEAVGQRTFVLGDEPVTAFTVKLLMNFMLASSIEMLAESFAVARKAGIDVDQFLDVITGTIFAAPIFSVYGKLIATQTSQPALFSVPLGLKDVREALAAAEAVEASLPLANVVRDSLISALAQGYAEHDWSVVAKVNAKRAGL